MQFYFFGITIGAQKQARGRGKNVERKDQKETSREPGENQSFTRSKVLKRGWKLFMKNSELSFNEIGKSW